MNKLCNSKGTIYIHYTVHYHTCQRIELHCTTKFYHFMDIFFKSYVRKGTTQIIILAIVSSLYDENYVVNYSTILKYIYGTHSSYTRSLWWSIGTTWWLKCFKIIQISRLLRIVVNFLSS